MTFQQCLTTGMVALAVTLSPTVTWAASSEAQLADNVLVYYNDQLLKSDQPAALADGRLLLPLRDFFNGIGMDVGWNDQTKVATVVKEGKTIVIRTESGRVTVNNAEVKPDVPPQIIKNRIYVPLRFLSETLDYQVDYTQQAQQHIVKINGREPELTRIANGTVTRIKDRTLPVAEPEDAHQAANFASWRAQHRDYFVDSSGYLHQVDTLAASLQIQRLDPPNATVHTTTTALALPYAAISDITRLDRNSFDIALATASTDRGRYVGVGQPSSGRLLTQFESKIGRLSLYDGQLSQSMVNVSTADGTSNGVFANTTRGYVLDTIECNAPSSTSDYAIAADGSYAFLLDNYFLIVNPADGKLVFEEIVSQGLTQGRVDYLDQCFVVSGIESSGISSASGFYTAVYATDGTRQQFYATQTQSLSNYDYMNILDSFSENTRLYALLETRYDNYLLVYDVAEHSSVVTELPYQYDQFVPTPTGMQLLMRHPDYFYLQDV